MYCEKCKLSVIVIDSEIIKACECEAPIIADMEATVIQTSNIDM